MTTEPAPAEVQDRERENRAEMDRMDAKPWRGGCRVCPGRLWCTDTEEEAHRLVSEHIASKHVLTPDIWREHPDPRPASMLQPADFADGDEKPRRVKLKPVEEADGQWWCGCEDMGVPHVHTPPWGGGPTIRAVDIATGGEIKPEAQT